MTLPRALALVLLGLSIGGPPSAAQGMARLTLAESFRASPDGEVLAELHPGVSVPIFGRQGAWFEVELTGWVWIRSLQERADGTGLVVSQTGGENLRDGPSGNVVGRLSERARLDELQRVPGWVNVRRVGWIRARSVVEEGLAAGDVGAAVDPLPAPPVAAAASAGAPTPPAADPTPAQEAPAHGTRGDTHEYAIRSGDRITIALFTAAGDEVVVVAGEHVVDLNGELFLPYLGTVQVAGYDEAELRTVLADLYGVFYPDAVVDLDVQLRVNVTGAVRTPGQYFVDPTATIVDAMSIAGGTLAELAVIASQLPANQREVRVVRDGETLILNLRPGEATEDALTMRVQSGDWIDVPYAARSRVRDDIVFFGTVVSFLSSIATLVILVR